MAVLYLPLALPPLTTPSCVATFFSFASLFFPPCRQYLRLTCLSSLLWLVEFSALYLLKLAMCAGPPGGVTKQHGTPTCLPQHEYSMNYWIVFFTSSWCTMGTSSEYSSQRSASIVPSAVSRSTDLIYTTTYAIRRASPATGVTQEPLKSRYIRFASFFFYHISSYGTPLIQVSIFVSFSWATFLNQRCDDRHDNVPRLDTYMAGGLCMQSLSSHSKVHNTCIGMYTCLASGDVCR